MCCVSMLHAYRINRKFFEYMNRELERGYCVCLLRLFDFRFCHLRRLQRRPTVDNKVFFSLSLFIKFIQTQNPKAFFVLFFADTFKNFYQSLLREIFVLFLMQFSCSSFHPQTTTEAAAAIPVAYASYNFIINRKNVIQFKTAARRQLHAELELTKFPLYFIL